MSYSLRAVLKSLNLLFISNKSDIIEKEVNIINMFFNKITFAYNIKKAYQIFDTEHPDIIIIDFEIEDNLGIDFCKRIRTLNNKIPIIVLSKNKKEEFLFEAIRIQVIDYIVRPVKVEDLIFSLNKTAKQLLNYGEITIKITNTLIYSYKEKVIIKEDDKKIKLTKNEFRLLELLLANKQHTLTKNEIERHLWGNEEITESAFKSLFSRLRQKIGKDTIKNSFGVGYQLVS